MKDLRTAQKEATRARIVRAVSHLVAHDHPAAISVPAVARQANVSVATVYRYFPTKEALLDGAARGAVSAEAARLPATLAEVGPALRAAWGELAEQLPLVRGQLVSPAGRDLHRRRWETKRSAMAAQLPAVGIDPESAIGQRLLGVADVLTSSTALLELHDKAKVPVDDAAAWCAWALDVLVQATNEEAER